MEAEFYCRFHKPKIVPRTTISHFSNFMKNSKMITACIYQKWAKRLPKCAVWVPSDLITFNLNVYLMVTAFTAHCRQFQQKAETTLSSLSKASTVEEERVLKCQRVVEPRAGIANSDAINDIVRLHTSAVSILLLPSNACHSKRYVGDNFSFRGSHS